MLVGREHSFRGFRRRSEAPPGTLAGHFVGGLEWTGAKFASRGALGLYSALRKVSRNVLPLVGCAIAGSRGVDFRPKSGLEVVLRSQRCGQTVPEFDLQRLVTVAIFLC